MPKPAALVTAAEISRLAGVTRATVSNWRRRHADFPAPVGGTDASPAYDLTAVRTWLAGRDQLPASSPAEELRTALRAVAGGSTATGRLLPLVLAADRLSGTDLRALAEVADDRLPQRAAAAVRPHAADLPGVEGLAYRATDVAALRALLRCVRDEGATRAIDVLAERGAEESGTYPTPAPLVDLMADLLAEQCETFPATVLDPACGTGGLLTAAARRGARELYGQDVVAVQAIQAAVRLGVLTRTATVRAGDSMRADAFPGLAAEAVLCNPPYGNRDWGHDELAYDPRWAHGLPPKGEPELAWVQHCLAHLRAGAPAVLLMPPASAERAAGRRIRAELVRSGALRAVVALPAGAAAPFHVGLHLWLLRRPHPQDTTPHTVLFVDSAEPGHRHATAEPARRAPLDWPATRDAVITAWRAYTTTGGDLGTVHGTARAVPVIDLLDASVDLTPARHVRTNGATVRPDEHAETARALHGRLHQAAAALTALSGAESCPPAGAEPRSWRTATVADLLRGGALTLLRAAAPSRAADTDADRPPAGVRVLTLQDVVQGQPPSGTADDPPGAEVGIRAGDVILPETLRAGPHTVRVADDGDTGQLLGRHLSLLRPDPRRLDAWFLAGFLSAEDNVNAAATGTSIVRVDVRRLRVPLLPLTEQQRYGHAFRQLRALRTAADLAHRLAEQTAHTLGTGLTAGALLPPAAAPASS
ncbi:N-6 DNA methylase [Dactylosporangium sp. NPDC049525]|uniref:N-6 DNA methylase n=1 Tax=Dactylosporangium sp. NPDC049525 TaxID=3154730 RepID=UPI00343A69E4